MDFKALALASTLGGTVLLSGLTFSGAINLQDIKNMGFGWGDKVVTSVNETKDMLSKFNLFKADVTTLLNEKIAKINELNQKLTDLKASGDGDLGEANNEIARLNEELEKANQEVQALKDEYNIKDAEIEQAFAQMNTDADMDTSLALDTQNADTVIPTDSTSGGSTTDSGSTTTTNDYATEESALQTAIMNNWTGLNPVTAEITDTTVTLTGSNVTANTPDQYISYINNATGKTATYSSQTATSYTYTIQ